MISSLVKHSLRSTLNRIPVSLLRRLGSINLFLPFYHIVSDEYLPHVKQLFHYRSQKQFEAEIDYFLKFWNPICLEDLIGYIKEGKSIPRYSMLLTFDDGFREMHDIVSPILKRKGVPAVFFLCPPLIDNKRLFYRNKMSMIIEKVQAGEVQKSALEMMDLILKENNKYSGVLRDDLRSISYNEEDIFNQIGPVINLDFDCFLKKNQPYLTSAQVKNMIKDGFEFGGHSIDHPLYKELSLEDQIMQTIESTQIIKRRFNLSYGTFAFPFNDYGVGDQFFKHIYNDNDLLDISFGCGWGIKDERCPQHLQRVTFEETPKMPEVKVKKLVEKRIRDRIAGKTMVVRT